MHIIYYISDMHLSLSTIFRFVTGTMQLCWHHAGGLAAENFTPSDILVQHRLHFLFYFCSLYPAIKMCYCPSIYRVAGSSIRK